METSHSAAPAPNTNPPAAQKKRPWLPLKHLIGLGLVGLFIAGSLTAGVGFINTRSDDMAAEGERLSVEIGNEMSAAMLRGDREAFVSWGEGEGAEQLGRLWDETKKIGWDTGWTDFLRDVIRRDDGTSDLADTATMTFAVALGFNNTRAANGEAGTLWQSVDYDLTTTGAFDQIRITSLTPVTPMPWDDPNGVAVASDDNVVLFSYADEGDLPSRYIADGQNAAEQLLSSQLAQEPDAQVEGFVGFVTADRQRWQQGAYAPGDTQSEVGRDALAVAKLYSDLLIVSPDVAEQPGLASMGGSMVFFSDKALGDGMFRTMSHEFAHSLHQAYVPDIAGSFLGEEVGIRAVTEGYAVLAADKIAGAVDGHLDSDTAEVRDAVVNGDIEAITDTAAFADSEAAELAYNVAGNYLLYASAQGADIGRMLTEAGYTVVPFWMWVDQPDQGLSTEGWKEWAAAQ
ncbi:MAG: hypothetical protein ACTJHU_02215 [Mycetocola sp.]